MTLPKLPKIRRASVMTPSKTSRVTFSARDMLASSGFKLPCVPHPPGERVVTFLSQDPLLTSQKRGDFLNKALVPRPDQGLIPVAPEKSLVPVPAACTSVARRAGVRLRPLRGNLVPSLETLRASRAVARRARLDVIRLIPSGVCVRRDRSRTTTSSSVSSISRRRPNRDHSLVSIGRQKTTWQYISSGSPAYQFNDSEHEEYAGKSSKASSRRSPVRISIRASSLSVDYILDEEPSEKKLQLQGRWKTVIKNIILAGRVCQHIAGTAFALEAKTRPLARGSLYDAVLDRGKKKTDKKVRGEVLLTYKVQSILLLPPENRTAEQSSQVLRNLQMVPSFCAYPMGVQQKIARHCTFISVGPNRVIVRQGSFADNWYFVINGQAFATVVDTEGDDNGGVPPAMTRTFFKMKRVHKILSRGMSFGEMDILSKTTRQFTVTSRRPMQLIMIDKDDFKNVFRSVSALGDRSVPDHIRYVKNLAFMQHWPWRNLLPHPTQCFQHFVRDNTVLVPDSTDNDWIYVVRSGECAVYMYVERTKASWRDLELYLAHPTINIDGWPGPRTDKGTRQPWRRGSGYALYSRLSSPDLVQRDLLQDRPHLMLGPPYRRHHLVRDKGRKAPAGGSRQAVLAPGGGASKLSCVPSEQRLTVNHYLPQGTRIHCYKPRRSHPRDVKHPYQPIKIRLPQLTSDKRSQMRLRADAKEGKPDKKVQYRPPDDLYRKRLILSSDSGNGSAILSNVSGLDKNNQALDGSSSGREEGCDSQAQCTARRGQHEAMSGTSAERIQDANQNHRASGSDASLGSSQSGASGVFDEGNQSEQAGELDEGSQGGYAGESDEGSGSVQTREVDDCIGNAVQEQDTKTEDSNEWSQGPWLSNEIIDESFQETNEDTVEGCDTRMRRTVNSLDCNDDKNECRELDGNCQKDADEEVVRKQTAIAKCGEGKQVGGHMDENNQAINEEGDANENATNAEESQDTSILQVGMQEGALDAKLLQNRARNASMRQDGARNASMRQDEAVNATMLQDGFLNATMPQDGNRNASMPQDGNRNASMPQDGNRNATMPQDGNRNATMPQDETGEASMPQNIDVVYSESRRRLLIVDKTYDVEKEREIERIVSHGASSSWTAITLPPRTPRKAYFSEGGNKTRYFKRQTPGLRKKKSTAKRKKTPLSSFAIRKNYKIPDKCLPPKPPPVQRTDPYTCHSPPVYVEVEKLTEGDVFGLDQLGDIRKASGWTKTHKVRLVSRGAEVIMMRKRFYTSYMSGRTREDVRLLAPAYPSPETVQARLRLQLAWKMWCRKVSDDFHHDLDMRKKTVRGCFFTQPGKAEWTEVLRDLKCVEGWFESQG